MKIGELKNLGGQSEKMLAAAGIGSVEELRELGPVAAYLKVKRCGGDPSLNLVYAIAGALTDTHWAELDPDERTRILIELDAAMDAERRLEEA